MSLRNGAFDFNSDAAKSGSNGTQFDFRKINLSQGKNSQEKSRQCSKQGNAPSGIEIRMHPHGGACPACSQTLQTKLKIGKAGDRFEREADTVAEKVVGTNADGAKVQKACSSCDNDKTESKPVSENITPLVQMEEKKEDDKAQGKPLTEGSVQREEKKEDDKAQGKPLTEGSVQREEKKEDEKAQGKPLADGSIQREEKKEDDKAQGKSLTDGSIQREEKKEDDKAQGKRAANTGPEVTAMLGRKIDSMKGGGSPLPKSTLSFMEGRFGVDFSKVRIHTDSNAIVASNMIRAKAFTVGNNIAFNTGFYSPNTKEGKRLLAHELTHVVQQNGKQPTKVSLQSKTPIPVKKAKKHKTDPLKRKIYDLYEEFQNRLKTQKELSDLKQSLDKQYAEFKKNIKLSSEGLSKAKQALSNIKTCVNNSSMDKTDRNSILADIEGIDNDIKVLNKELEKSEKIPGDSKLSASKEYLASTADILNKTKKLYDSLEKAGACK